MVKLKDLYAGLELLSSEEFEEFIAIKINMDSEDFYIQNVDTNMFGGIKIIYSSYLNNCDNNCFTMFDEEWGEFLKYYYKN